MDKVWFYTGTEMKDGTKRTMGAIDEAQVKEYEKKGLVRVEKDEPKVIVASDKKKSKKVKGKSDGVK
jgi:hypothetical protein